jgi:hypothetical protein
MLGPTSSIMLHRGTSTNTVGKSLGGNCYYNRVGLVTVDSSSNGSVVTQYSSSNVIVWSVSSNVPAVISTDEDGSTVVLGTATGSQVVSQNGSVARSAQTDDWGLAAGPDEFVSVNTAGGAQRSQNP